MLNIYRVFRVINWNCGILKETLISIVNVWELFCMVHNLNIIKFQLISLFLTANFENPFCLEMQSSTIRFLIYSGSFNALPPIFFNGHLFVGLLYNCFLLWKSCMLMHFNGTQGNNDTQAKDVRSLMWNLYDEDSAEPDCLQPSVRRSRVRPCFWALRPWTSLAAGCSPGADQRGSQFVPRRF